MQQVNFKKTRLPNDAYHLICITVYNNSNNNDAAHRGQQKNNIKKKQTMHQSRQKQSSKSPMMNTIRIVLLSYHIIYFL